MEQPAHPPRRKHATVSFREDVILVESISYSGRLGVSDGPFFWLTEGSDVATLGRVAREAMNSGRSLPLDFDVRNRKQFEVTLFHGTRYRSWRDFEKKAPLRFSH